MKYEYFIAKRIIGSKSYKSSVSAPIIKIGIAAIAIGIIVMLVAIATGIGLQQKIRDKAVAFNGHVTISNFDTNISDESVTPISTLQDFYPNFDSIQLNIDVATLIPETEGQIKWNNEDFTMDIVSGMGPVYQVNQENVIIVYNDTGYIVAGVIRREVGPKISARQRAGEIVGDLAVEGIGMLGISEDDDEDKTVRGSGDRPPDSDAPG